MPLPLPKGLVIERDFAAEQELHDKARAYLDKGSEKRTGIHASDLISPRLTAWRRVSGDAGVPDHLVNMFVVGQLAHAIIEVIHAGDGTYLTHGMDDGTKIYKDLHYSPDILEYKGGPAEIKTTRSFYEPKAAYLPDDETFHAYFEQLMTYMAAENKVEGRLVMLYLNMKVDGRTRPQFYIWSVKTSPEALAAFRRVLEQRMTQLSQALADKTPNILPLCRPFLCRDCEYWSKCAPPGRFEHGQAKEKLWTA